MDIENPLTIIGGLLVIVLVLGGIVWLVSGAPERAPIEKKPIEEPSVPKVEPVVNNNKMIKATIKTARGEIALELYPEVAPKTVENFISKAKAGYFNGLRIHRVEDWVMQGGDPLSKDPAQEARWGTGGGNIATELSARPFIIGALGVARGPDIKVSNDSQFFIVKKDAQFLNNQYTLFGQTISGMDIVNATQVGDTIQSIYIQ